MGDNVYTSSYYEGEVKRSEEVNPYPVKSSKSEQKPSCKHRHKPNIEVRASLLSAKFLSFCLHNVLTWAPW